MMTPVPNCRRMVKKTFCGDTNDHARIGEKTPMTVSKSRDRKQGKVPTNRACREDHEEQANAKANVIVSVHPGTCCLSHSIGTSTMSA